MSTSGGSNSSNGGNQHLGGGNDPALDRILSRLNRDIGDYHNLLEDTLETLKKTDPFYGKLELRMESMLKSAIDLKEVEDDILTSRKKQAAAALSMKELNEKNSALFATAEASIEAAFAAQKAGNLDPLKDIVAHMNQLRDGDPTQPRDETQKILDEQELAVFAAIMANKQHENKIDLLKEELKLERLASSYLGFTGIALKNISKYLGLNNTAYKAMVAKARELAAENAKYGWFMRRLKGFVGGFKVLWAGISSMAKEFWNNLFSPEAWVAGVAFVYNQLGKLGDFVGNMAAKGGDALAGMSEDSGNNIRNLTSGVTSLIKQIPLVGGLIGGIIDGLAGVVDLLIGVDDMVVKAGRSLNMSADKVRALNHVYQDVSATSGNIYMTSRDYLKTLVSINEQLGVNNMLSTAALNTSYMLNKYAGIEFDTLAEIEKISKVNGMSQEDSVKSILGQVEALKDVTGIEFNQQKILKEVAGSTGLIGLQFTKYPAKLTQSLLTVKALGLELKDIEGIADSMLDFESSVAKEFEAQLLTGKNINLAKVRQLALDNDLAGVALEINNQIGSTEEFLNMNRIAQESYAAAVGMSRDGLADMLRKQEYLSILGAKDTDNAREQLRLGLAKYKTHDALREAMKDENYQALINASTQEKISEYIEKIKQSIVDFVERSGIIDKIKDFVAYISEPANLNGIIGTIRDYVAEGIRLVSFLLADILEVGGHIADVFTMFGSRDYSDEAKVVGAQMREFGLQAKQKTLSVGASMMASEVGGPGTSGTKEGGGNVVVINQNSIEPVFDGQNWVLKLVTTSQTMNSDGSKMNTVTK